MNRRSARALLAAGLALVVSAAAPAANPVLRPFAYTITEGRNLNAFFRQGPVAAHLLLRSGRDPRLIVAFPAGNSGTGLWFGKLAEDARWRIDRAPKGLTARDRNGRPLYGIVTEVSIDAPALEVRQAVLSSVRVLRDFEFNGRQPAEVTAAPAYADRTVVWARDRLDGAPGYSLKLEVLAGKLENGRIGANAGEPIRLRITALSGEKPLTPLAGAQLLNTRAAADPAARRTLEFLSYNEKFLAGSWRFDTYFGRDTLMSVRLLMPVLQPRAVEAGLGAVLARLSPQGEVAHEEDIGEFAVLDHLRRDRTTSDEPVYDYKMIDGTPMLAAVAGHWLLEDPRGRGRARAFLAAPAGAGRSNGAALVVSLEKIVSLSERFAADPKATNLVAIKPGLNVGNWRDSEDGLGAGRYPYDVNAVLMPAALDAAARLERSGLLDPWLDRAAHAHLRSAAAMAAVWQAKAPALFDQQIARTAAEHAIRQAALAAGISPQAALNSLPHGPLQYPALSLDAEGEPVAVMNSDVGFALLFSRPSPDALETIAGVVSRPYPAGLQTPAGMLVANPAFAPSALQGRFARSAYHGMVIWSWQQALVIAGLDRQLERKDLPQRTRHMLVLARNGVTKAVRANRALRNSELWSWQVVGGSIVPNAFGASSGDSDESNAAQLWSSAFLGLMLN